MKNILHDMCRTEVAFLHIQEEMLVHKTGMPEIDGEVSVFPDVAGPNDDVTSVATSSVAT
jgi:hypothetical protein